MRSALLLAFGAMLAWASPVAADCGAENAFAIELSNEADRMRATDLDGAIAKYVQASEQAPQSHRILWKLAMAFQKKEQWDKVASTLAKASDLAPKNARYLAMRGTALAHQAATGPTDWSEVKGVFERAIALDPNLADARYELAEADVHLGDEKGALVHYTKAVELAQAEAKHYAALADLYLRLNFDDQAERVLTLGEARVPDEAKKFALYTLHGALLDNRGDAVGALSRYEAAKKACGACFESGQHIAFFNLGASYAIQKPPRKAEAMSNLHQFQKMICKGAAAARYADQCTQAQLLASRLGGVIQ